MAKKVYILAEEMRVGQSPFYMEGTDMQFNIPDEYPLPLECTVIEDGQPVELRYIPSSKFVEKQKQIDLEKRPYTYVPKDDDRKLITFQHGRLELDEVKHKNACEYIDRVYWNKKNSKFRPDGSKIIFEEYREDEMVENLLAQETLVNRAKSQILAMKEGKVRDLYLLSLPGSSYNEQLSVSKMKTQLLQIAAGNPNFILNGIKDAEQKIAILTHKAIQHKILSLDFNGAVMIVNVTGNWDKLIEVSEAGGAQAKFNRLVEYLMSEAGESVVPNLQKKVAAAEETALV